MQFAKNPGMFHACSPFPFKVCSGGKNHAQVWRKGHRHIFSPGGMRHGTGKGSLHLYLQCAAAGRYVVAGGDFVGRGAQRHCPLPDHSDSFPLPLYRPHQLDGFYPNPYLAGKRSVPGRAGRYWDWAAQAAGCCCFLFWEAIRWERLCWRDWSDRARWTPSRPLKCFVFAVGAVRLFDPGSGRPGAGQRFRRDHPLVEPVDCSTALGGVAASKRKVGFLTPTLTIAQCRQLLFLPSEQFGNFRRHLRHGDLMQRIIPPFGSAAPFPALGLDGTRLGGSDQWLLPFTGRSIRV